MFDFPVEEVEDDPDVLEDPIYSMDIQVWQIEFCCDKIYQALFS